MKQERFIEKRQELSMEKAEALMKERIGESLERNKTPFYTSFGLLINSKGHPVLAERLKPPHEGSYSVVGGKIEQSHLQDKNQSDASLSYYLNEDGLESPTESMMREVSEEMYRSLLSKPMKNLEELFHPERLVTVYDYNQNAYCFLYTLTQPEQIPGEIATAEVGQIKELKDVPTDKINPLTQFFLKHLSFQAALPSTMSYGPLKHMALPSDCLRYAKTGSVALSKHLHKPAFLIKY